MTDALENDVSVLLRQVLGLAPDAEHPLVREHLVEWDSLKHMELIFALEDRFGVRFDESEFAQLQSSDSIAAILRAHDAA